jgi:hypothetical protein
VNPDKKQWQAGCEKPTTYGVYYTKILRIISTLSVVKMSIESKQKTIECTNIYNVLNEIDKECETNNYTLKNYLA